MSDEPEVEPQGASGEAADGASSRRRFLRLGAVAGGVVLTIRPGIAQAATSVLNCSIPVPDPARSGNAIAPDGALVPQGTPGAYPGGRIFHGQDVRRGLRGGSLPGTSHEESEAYLNYIRRLQYGRSGFTCYASLQMPR